MKNILRVSVCCLVLIGAANAFAQVGKTQVQPVDVYVRSAKIALGTNPPEYQRALDNLYKARANYPDNYEVHFLLASIWADKDEIDSMVAEFALAKEYATEKQWQKKADDVERIYEGKWLERFNRAVTRVNQADSVEENALTLSDTQMADSMMWLAGQLRGEAKEALRHCSLLKPEDFRAYSTRGLIYQREGVVDSSIADLRRAESLFHRHEFGDSTTNWYDTTVFFSGPEGKPTKRFKEYENDYKHLSDEKKTRYHNLLVSLIGAYYENGQWDNAIALGRRFYGLEPDDINNIVTLADIFSRLNMDDEAFKWQEAVVRRDPGSKDTWYNMGIFYYNTAVRLQDSVSKYDEFLADHPGDAEATESLHSFAQRRLDNFYKAIPRFEKVVEIDEGDEDTWRLLAICSYSMASTADDLAASGSGDIVQSVMAPNTYDREATWAQAKERLAKALGMFPDDQNMCRMMLVTLAQLRLMDELEQWKKKCQSS
jgi:tetratricopeptide (TPR) repeat protein